MEHSSVSSRRQRRLTITYGTETGPLRTLSMPVTRVNATLVTLAVAVVWTMASLVYVSVRGITSLVQGQELAARPEPLAELPLVPAVASVATALPETAPAVVEPVIDKAPAEAPPAVATAVPELPPVETSSAASTLAAGVDDVAFSRNQDGMVVRFGVVNLGNAPLAGNVSGTALVLGEDGTTIEVPATATPSFRAKMRSLKQLTFALPPDHVGKITGVRIKVQDSAGVLEVIKVYEAPANFQ